MFNGMMDPEMIRLAQEQMSRISPQELARIQQQMFSNPELMKLASESMKNMNPEDIRTAAEQLKHTRPEEMAEIGEKMANASPDEIAAMRARAEAQASYELNAAQMLKQQGNELHSHGKYRNAAQKYLLAKNNLKGIPLSKCRMLQLQCSLNLMSCYLKTRQFDECIQEGSQVLAYDSMNVKALYRRGQAYKELGNLEAAVDDLSKAHEASPEDETIADVLRDAKEKLINKGSGQNKARGVIIEEIVEEDNQPITSEGSKRSSVEYPVSSPLEAGSSASSGSVSETVRPAVDTEFLQGLKDDPEAIRSFQNYISNSNPDSLAALTASGMPPEMIRTATDMISKMKPGELQKILQIASSMNVKDPHLPGTNKSNANGSGSSSQFPEMSPEMINMATEKINKMSPEELQKMVEIASSLKPPFQTSTSNTSNGRSATGNCSRGEGMPEDLLSESTVGPSTSGQSTSTADMQENARNAMKDPAMRQMFSSMMKSMSPEMMANMSEQFGVKLSKEDAAKAQEAMSSLSPDDLDKMLRWVERAQKGVETAKKAKNWLLGRPGMILAICMLLLAVIFHWLGFIGS